MRLQLEAGVTDFVCSGFFFKLHSLLIVCILEREKDCLVCSEMLFQAFSSVDYLFLHYD